MDIIPPAVRSVVEKYLMQLLYWFSDEIYKLLLPRAQNHFLVGLRNHLNFGTLETACAKYHHEGGRGAPVVHPVPRLVRALLVKYLLNLSLRDLEESIRWNLLVKWFVGYAAFESGPDHATLERFELWVIEHQTRTFFDQILKQIDHDCDICQYTLTTLGRRSKQFWMIRSRLRHVLSHHTLPTTNHNTDRGHRQTLFEQQTDPLIVFQIALNALQCMLALPRYVRRLQTLLVQPNDLPLVRRTTALIHLVALQRQRLPRLRILRGHCLAHPIHPDP